MLKLITVVLCAITVHAARQRYSVIIVGAGAAGIAAATRLLENNFTDFIVLESSSRLGGRINSFYYGNGFLDQGAEWVHGSDGNIVYNMAKKWLKPDREIFEVFTSDGSEVERALSDELYEIWGQIYFLDPDELKKVDESIGQYFRRRYISIVNKKYGNDKRKLKLAMYALQNLNHFTLAEEGALSWYFPSAIKNFIYSDFINYHWSGSGYKTLLEIMMWKFTETDQSYRIDGKILLKRTVRRINWKKNLSVETDYDNFDAELVIFTPSLGILKKYHKNMFNPELPPSKKRAIETLGFGAVMKVHLEFPNIWLEDEYHFYSFFWKPDDIQALRFEHPETIRNSGSSWLLDFYAIYPSKNNTKILTCWLTGDSVPYIGRLTDLELLDGLMIVIRTFLSAKYRITEPNLVSRHSWYDDPHILGSYSYETVASRRAPSNEILGEPLRNQNGVPVVLFAGEATSPVSYSTVHGAVESGYREAERILQIVTYKKHLG